MKRILSVILSLALLASLLIIPMSVSAGETSAPVTTEYTKADISARWTDVNNVALGVVPKLYKYNGTTRTEKLLRDEVDIAKLSNGDLTGGDVSFDIFFKNKVDGAFTDYVNNYTPGEAFDFKQESYDAYVDLVYDLGRPTDINKFQHIAASDNALAMGVYQLYASDSATNLFSEDSLICNYQNFDTATWSGKKSQEIEFPTRTAQYVAIRCYMSITKCDATTHGDAATGNHYYNCFRIGDIAIYGTPSDTAAYKVTEIQAPTGGADAPESVPTGDLLNADTFESVKSYENKELIQTWKYNTAQSETYFVNKALIRLYSQTYYNAGHGDFNCGVKFYSGGKCKNGYSFDRSNTNGNIVFNVPNQAPTVYYDFTYDLGDYYKIDRFGAYLSSNDPRRIQAYEVYIGNDRDELYTGEPVVVYNNYYNTYGQMITFDQAKVGKYIGFRVLNPGTANDDDATYVRLDELAAYGECVGAPPAIDVAPGETCGSAVVTVTDVDGNLESVTLNETPVTLDENGKFTVSEIGDYTVVATDEKGNVTTKEFTVADHNYQYTADGAVITETCANCDRPAETLTLKVVDGPLVYDGSDKSTSIIAEKTEGFAGWEGGIDFEIDGKPAESVINAGDYVAKATIDGVAFAELPFTIEKAIPEYTAPEDEAGEAGEELSTIKLDDGFTWKNPTEKIKYSNGDKFEYDAIYTPADVDNYKIAELKIKVNGVDITPPTGTIKIKETVWDKLTNVVFGWFINEKETVTITGSDAGSGVGKIYYYVADAAAENIADDAWTEYTGSFKIEKEGNNVVYAKIVDVAGNEPTIINTDGIVLDTKAPSADVTNLGKYYGSLTVTVTEDNLDTVKLDGKDVTLEDGKFTVSAADKEQTIVITDKAGNETTYKVTVVEVKGFVPADGKLTVDMDEKNIDKADKDKIAAGLDKGETVTFFDISVENATSTTTNVLEVPVDFDFTGKLDVKVLHNHGGVVNDLKALTARPTADFENGTFFADVENKLLYIYTKEFSTFAVAFHVHDLKHVEAKAATAEADGNIEYWYCEGCDKYFSDAAATKEITKESTVVKYVAPSNGNTGSGSNAPTTGGETENNATVPGGTSPVTGETAMTVVLFAILLGALAVMGVSIVKSRKAKSK